MPFTIINSAAPKVQFTEHAQSIGQEETWETDRTEVVRQYFTSWDDRQDARLALLGYPYINNSGSVHYLQRYLPYALPEYRNPTPGSNFLYATKVRTRGYSPQSFDANYNAGTFAQALHTVTFSTLPYDVLADPQITQTTNTDGFVFADESFLQRYVIKNPRPSGDYFTVNPASAGASGIFYYCTNDGSFQAVQQGIPKLRIFSDFTLTWCQIPVAGAPCYLVNPNLTSPGYLELALGTVNNARLSGRFRTGSMLLCGAEIRTYVHAVGIRLCDITYHWRYFNPTGVVGGTALPHNLIYWTGTGGVNAAGYYEVVAGGNTTNFPALANGKNIYDYTNHSLLFQAQP